MSSGGVRWWLGKQQRVADRRDQPRRYDVQLDGRPAPGTWATLAKNTKPFWRAMAASYANKLNPSLLRSLDVPHGGRAHGLPEVRGACDGHRRLVSRGYGFLDSTYDLGATQNQPVYIPNDVIIPTLDDAPDGADANMGPTGNDGYTPGEWTITDLAFLDAVGQHFDIFMNSDNWATVTTNPADGTCDADGYDAYVQSTFSSKNHFPANHIQRTTPRWAGTSWEPATCFQYAPTQPQCCDCSLCPTTDCATELSSLEALVAGISNNGRTHLTRFRYPYGYPVQGAMGERSHSPTCSPRWRKFAVQVGVALPDGRRRQLAVRLSGVVGHEVHLCGRVQRGCLLQRHHQHAWGRTTT